MTSEGSSYGGFEPADGAFPGRHHSHGQRPPADLPPWNGFGAADPDAEEPDNPPPGVPDQHWDSPRATASQPADPRGGYPPPPTVYRSSTGAAEPAPRTGAVYGGGPRTSGSAAVPPPPPDVPAPAERPAPPTSPAGPGRATVYGSARSGAPTPPPPPPPVPHAVPAPPTPTTPVVPAPTSSAVPVAARRPAAYPPAEQGSYAPPQQRAPHPSERQPEERYAEPATASSRVYGAPRGGEPVEPTSGHPDQHRTAAYPAAGTGYPPNDGSGYPPPPPHGNPGGRGAPDGSGGQQYGQPVPPPPPARPSGGTTYGAAPAGRPPASGGQPPHHPPSGHPGYQPPPPPPPEDPNATSIIPVTRDADPYAPDPYGQDPYGEPDPYAAEPDPYAEETRVPGDRPAPPVPPAATAPPAGKPGRTKLVVGIVLALAVVLILSGIAYYLAVVRGDSADYKIGSCVKQQGTSAVLVDCSQAGVYRIDKQVPDKSACDATQPYIIVDNKNGTTDTFCLVPK